jgi:hypothetical protein
MKFVILLVAWQLKNHQECIILMPKFDQMLSQYISSPLSHVYNLSLKHGILPDKFKVAKVVPIFKKGDTNLPNNYRPISLLSIFDQILEKL